MEILNLKSVKRLGFVFIVFVLLFASLGSMTAGAYSEQDYVLASDGWRIYIPRTYSPESAQNYLGDVAGQLNSPTDIFVTKDDIIYILDGGNKRVISMDTKFENVKVVDNFGAETLENPNGLYVYENGDLLIADMGKEGEDGKVLHTDKDGKFIKKYVKPTSELYSDDYGFKPSKVYVNKTNQLFIINHEDYHGFIILDENNEFKGYFAATRLPYNFINHLISIFASEDQKEMIGQKKPPVHTNLVIDEKNRVYSTTARAEKAQLELFSTVGKNIYPMKDFFGEGRGDPILSYYGKNFTEPEFTDVTANADGTVTILDVISGRIYQYDAEGMMLTAFGGTGQWAGKFTQAVGIAQDSNGTLYVIDKAQSTVHTLKPTAFIKTIHKAIGLYYSGEYQEAVQYWDEVLALNPNYPMAHIGRGNAYIKSKEYKLAMTEFELAENKQGYSDAFDKWELDVVRNYFGWILIGIIAIVLGIILFIAYLRKRYKATYERESRIKWFNSKGRLRILLGTIFDSNEGFREIRRHRNDYDIVVPIIIYILVIVARIFTLFMTHYPFNNVEFYRVSLSTELLTLFIPIFTWIISNYMVTTICSGEVKLREVFSASAYCMLPYVIISIPLALFSNVISLSNAGIYNGIISLMWAWIFIMFFVSTMSMNSYGFFETVKIILLTLFACVFLWLVLLLIFMLGQQVIDFFGGIIDNIRMYLLLQGGGAS